MNDVSTNNVPFADPMPMDNISTSDELSSPEIYSSDLDTKYAIKKRKTKLSKTAIITLTLSASAVSGGVLISNAFIGAQPVINNFDTCYEVVEQTFKYNLDIEITNAKLEMSVLKGEELIKDFVFDSTGVFTGEVELPEPNDYQVKFYSTNLFDYKNELVGYHITFTI